MSKQDVGSWEGSTSKFSDKFFLEPVGWNKREGIFASSGSSASISSVVEQGKGNDFLYHAPFITSVCHHCPKTNENALSVVQSMRGDAVSPVLWEINPNPQYQADLLGSLSTIPYFSGIM